MNLTNSVYALLSLQVLLVSVAQVSSKSLIVICFHICFLMNLSHVFTFLKYPATK